MLGFGHGLGRTIRDARRTREILGVLVRYGFRNLIEELHLEGALHRRMQRLLGRPVDPEVEAMPQAVRLRLAMQELGPTFIKLGQVLSLRPDLIPPDWASEFSKLHSEVPPVSFHRIQGRLEAEFGDRLGTLFRSIEETPIAAASMAQVHRAVSSCGREVVLKVLRPGVESVTEADMDILRLLAGFVEHRFKDLPYSPTEVVREFAEELEKEVDLEHEGRACDRFRGLFKQVPEVSFPEIFWEMTTPRVLAMEEIRGTLLSSPQAAELSAEARRQAVSVGADAVFRMCLEFGFFHADPHPGNIFVRPEGGICLIDCGMTGEIDPGTAETLADLVQGVLAADLERVLGVVVALGDADPGVMNDRALRADTWKFIRRFEQASLAGLDLGALLEDFFDGIRRHRLRVPSDIVFLIKAITTIEGVGERLAPDFDIVGHVRPHLERLVRRRFGMRAIRGRVQRSLLGYAQVLEQLPANLRSFAYAVRRQRLTMNLEHRGLDELTETIRRAAANLANAVFVGSLILGAAVLMLADAVHGSRGSLTVIAWVAIAFAAAFTIARIVGNRFR
jgi:ubiquinone biosynthesis protein